MAKMSKHEALVMYPMPQGWAERRWAEYLVQRGKNVDERHGVIGKSMREAGEAILAGTEIPPVPPVPGPERG